MPRLAVDRRLALAGVVVLAVVVRLAGIGDRLSADEGYSWLVSSAPDADGFLDRLAAYENTPPLLYLLLAPLPDSDEAWLRLPSLMSSVAAVPVLYAIVRPLAGTTAALLSALALAVAPYHVSFANYSRAFTLASLGLLLALWAAARLAQGGRRRWWWLWAAGAVIALYSEYDAGLALAAMAGTLLAIGTPARRDVLRFAPLPLLALVPWLPELADSLRALDETKVSPTYPAPGPESLRDVATALALGEHGSADSAGVRTLQFLVIAGALVACGALVRSRSELLLRLLAGAGLGTLALAAAVALVGPDVFAQRYLTFTIPLGAAIGGSGVAVLAARRRALAPLAATALVAAGAAVFVTREGRELEPDPAPVRAAVVTAGPDLVLTNSATVAWYLRDARPVLDRPFGLSGGPAARTPPCPPPCSIVTVDDTRVAGGPRPGAVDRVGFGPIVVASFLPGGRS